MTDLHSLIETYGYYAVFLGTFLEGETILVMAGFAAHRGHLSLPWVMVVAFAGSLLGDQFFFFLGRRHGAALLARFPQLRKRATTFERLLHDYHAPLIVVVRFLYGLRIVGPIVIGMSQVPAYRFIIFNVTGAIIWAIAIAGAGYLFGHAIGLLLHDIQHYEVAALGAVALAGAIVWLVYRVRNAK